MAAIQIGIRVWGFCKWRNSKGERVRYTGQIGITGRVKLCANEVLVKVQHIMIVNWFQFWLLTIALPCDFQAPRLADSADY